MDTPFAVESVLSGIEGLVAIEPIDHDLAVAKHSRKRSALEELRIVGSPVAEPRDAN
jgi:hypothetical protein